MVEFLRDEEAFAVLEVSGRVAPFVVTAIDELGQLNTVRCYDLAIDPASLRDLSDSDLAKRMSRRPNALRCVKTNAAPTLCALNQASEKMLGGVSTEESYRRARLVREDTAFVARLLAVADATETTTTHRRSWSGKFTMASGLAPKNGGLRHFMRHRGKIAW